MQGVIATNFPGANGLLAQQQNQKKNAPDHELPGRWQMF